MPDLVFAEDLARLCDGLLASDGVGKRGHVLLDRRDRFGHSEK